MVARSKMVREEVRTRIPSFFPTMRWPLAMLSGSVAAGLALKFKRVLAADRHELPKSLVARDRLGVFDMDDAEEVDGLPSGEYTRENLPDLSEETINYLADLKVRAAELRRRSINAA